MQEKIAEAQKKSNELANVVERRYVIEFIKRKI